MLPDAPRPEVGLMPWDEWNRTFGRDAQ
jgi:hypothetical protein